MGRIAKILAAVIVFAMVAALFCGCGKVTVSTEEPTYTNTEETENIGKVVFSRTEGLTQVVQSYQTGEWDGISETTNEILPGHTYSIRDGVLFEDGTDQRIYPDVTLGDVSFKGGEFLGRAPVADGILMVDNSNTTIARFYKGDFINCADLNAAIPGGINERACFFVLDRFVLVKFGQHLCIFDYLNTNEIGQWTTVKSADDIIDVVSNGEGILISNFKHENFIFTADGDIERTGGHFTKFPVDLDLDMTGVESRSIGPNGRALYAGSGIEEKWYYMYQNAGDYNTYTLVYRNHDTGVVRIVSEDVTDAETIIGGCYFIENGKVYYTRTDDSGVEVNKVYYGTAYGLSPAYSEEDAVGIITAADEANVHDSNGWENLHI